MLENFDSSDFQKKNLYEIIADELEKSILHTPEMLGEKLPAEQTVAGKFGVSRNIVREAFKILQERGLLQIKNGDGSYVTKPQAELFTQQIKRMVSFNQTDLSELYEVRAMFEKEAAAVIAQRITDDNIAKITKLAEKMRESADDQSKYVKYDLDFHCLIIKSADNTILYSLYKPIANALGIMIPFSSQSDELRNSGIIQHCRIAQAISERNEFAITEAIKVHIEDAKKDLLTFLSQND